ncbi:MAG: hypothetical protein ACOYN6_12990 [Ignavibacteria bacterium]
MKKLIIILSLFLSVNLYSQDISKPKNIVYLDLGVIITGTPYAFGVGLNYERMLSDNFSIRAGVNLGLYNNYVIGDKVAGTSIGFPVTINYMTNNKNKFEAGLGGGPRISLTDENTNIFFPSIRLGYRYQPDESGMMYRLGVELPSNMYISLAGIGYKFK